MKYRDKFSASWDVKGWMLVTPKTGMVFPNPAYDWWRVHKTRIGAMKAAKAVSDFTGKQVAVRKVLITL